MPVPATRRTLPSPASRILPAATRTDHSRVRVARGLPPGGPSALIPGGCRTNASREISARRSQRSLANRNEPAIGSGGPHGLPEEERRANFNRLWLSVPDRQLRCYQHPCPDCPPRISRAALPPSHPLAGTLRTLPLRSPPERLVDPVNTGDGRRRRLRTDWRLNRPAALPRYRTGLQRYHRGHGRRLRRCVVAPAGARLPPRSRDPHTASGPSHCLALPCA